MKKKRIINCRAEIEIDGVRRSRRGRTSKKGEDE